jgi:hypothetical protein
MGFNISQIINKVLPVKPHSSAADGWENPYGTGAGQIVTSVQDNWQARLARLGSTKTTYVNNVATTAGSSTILTNIRPTTGRLAFFTHITISANGSGVASFGYLVGNDNMSYSKYIPAGGSLDIKLDGAILIRGEVNLQFKADNAGTLAWASAIWMEVEE